MELWPNAQQRSFATADVHVRPRICVSASTLHEGCETPLHVHPSHDQLIFIARGNANLHLRDGRRVVATEGSTLIIRAGRSHGFSVDEGTAHIISVMMGEGAELPEKTSLPETVKKFATKMHPSHLAMAVANEPAGAAEMHSMSEEELRTLLYAFRKTMKSNGGEPKRRWFERKTERQPILAWLYNNVFYLTSNRIRVSLKFEKRGGNQFAIFNDALTVREIDFTTPPSIAQTIPVVN